MSSRRKKTGQHVACCPVFTLLCSC